jgi:hypothetical protein
MEELMSYIRNGTTLSLTSFNSHVGKGSNTQDVVGDLMSKLWMSDVAVGNNSSRDTHGAGRWSLVEDEASVEWE